MGEWHTVPCLSPTFNLQSARLHVEGNVFTCFRSRACYVGSVICLPSFDYMQLRLYAKGIQLTPD